MRPKCPGQWIRPTRLSESSPSLPPSALPGTRHTDAALPAREERRPSQARRLADSSIRQPVRLAQATSDPFLMRDIRCSLCSSPAPDRQCDGYCNDDQHPRVFRAPVCLPLVRLPRICHAVGERANGQWQLGTLHLNWRALALLLYGRCKEESTGCLACRLHSPRISSFATWSRTHTVPCVLTVSGVPVYRLTGYTGRRITCYTDPHEAKTQARFSILSVSRVSHGYYGRGRQSYVAAERDIHVACTPVCSHDALSPGWHVCYAGMRRYVVWSRWWEWQLYFEQSCRVFVRPGMR
jgi:hypothetical protein